MSLNKIRNEILYEFKPYIIKYGWSEKVFGKFAKKSKYQESVVLSLFPNGYISLIQLYLDEINLKMTNESKKINLIRLKTHERIRDIFILRLQIMAREKKLISKTFFHLLLPMNYRFSLSNLYKAVDQIWYVAGDNSTDFNFYSKRVILGSIYTIVLMHFINNNNFDDTVNLLNKQLRRVAKIPRIKNKFKQSFKLISHLFKFKKKFEFTRR